MRQTQGFLLGEDFLQHKYITNQHAPIGSVLNDFEDITPNRSCFCFKIVFLTLAFASGWRDNEQLNKQEYNRRFFFTCYVQETVGGVPFAPNKNHDVLRISNKKEQYESPTWYDDDVIFWRSRWILLEIKEGTQTKEITFGILCRLRLTWVFFEYWPSSQRLANCAWHLSSKPLERNFPDLVWWNVVRLSANYTTRQVWLIQGGPKNPERGRVITSLSHW